MKRNSTHGFTLLEVLISLGLITALMTLCWSLFSTFARLENRSRKTVAGLEVTRSLRRQIQNDLDQLVSFSGSETGNTTKTDKSGMALTQSVTLQPVQLSVDNYNTSVDSSSSGNLLPTSSLFEGNRQSLTFLVRNDGAFQEFGLDVEYLVVSYRWQNSSIANGEPTGVEAPGRDELTVDRESPEVSPPNKEFVRSVVAYRDYLRMPRQDLNEDSSQLQKFETIEIGATDDESSLDLGPIVEQIDRLSEISEVRFRFYAGQRWTSVWSGPELPVAIEVVFKIRSDNQSDSENDSSDDDFDFEFGSEIEIGDSESENAPEFEYGSELDSDRAQLERDFDPESKRFLIRVGTRLSGRTATEGGLDLESGFTIEEFE